MKIGILINSFNLGGAEKLMYDVAGVLYSRAIPFTLISMKKAETALELQIQKKLTDCGYETVSVNKPVGKGRLSSVISIKKIIQKYKIDILHTNGQSPDFYGRLTKLLLPKIKTVVTVHSTSGYNAKIEKMLSVLTTEYTAVSKQAEEYARNTLGIKKKVHVIDDGIDFKQYVKIQNNRKNKFVILSVGRVISAKGYLETADSVCEYLKINKSAEWYIVGDDTQDEKYVAAVKSRLRPEVSDRVKFFGSVVNTEEYYSKADVFLLPSAYEGFGIAFIEAMAAKLPVICNDVGVILDIKKAGGKVITLKYKSITECIDEAIQFKQEWLDFNYEYCRKNYSIEAVTDKYTEIYKSCMR